MYHPTAAARQSSQIAGPDLFEVPVLDETVLFEKPVLVASVSFAFSPCKVGVGGIGRTPRRGRQATKRAAIPAVSEAFQSPSGSRAIVAARAWTAASTDRFDSRAASPQGSKPSLARADSTVSG